MRNPRTLLLAVLASVLGGLVVASAAALTVNGGTLAVFTFPVRLVATPPVAKGPPSRCDTSTAVVRFVSGTATPYAPGALGSASTAAEARKPQGCVPIPPGAPGPPARFVEPQLRPSGATPTPAPSGGARFLGPPTTRR